MAQTRKELVKQLEISQKSISDRLQMGKIENKGSGCRMKKTNRGDNEMKNLT